MYLQLPYMRSTLVAHLKELGDKEYQLKNWMNNQHGNEFWYHFKSVIETLEIFEPSDVPGFGAKEQIGCQLYSEEEIDPIRQVVKIINKIIDKIGCKKQDSAYINSAYWKELISAANSAYQLLKKNDDKYQPLLRLTLISAVKALSDDKIKTKFKIQENLSFWPFFQDIFLNLQRFGITGNFKLYKHQIGSFWIIKNDEEVIVLEKLRESIHNFLKNIGEKKVIDPLFIGSITDLPGQPNEICINSPYLDSIIQSAQHAYEVLMKSEEVQVI